MKTVNKIQCLHPQGKQAPAIPADIYSLFENAIYHSVKNKKGKGISFSSLTEEIEKCFARQKTIFNGSVGWYAVHVKNHMEATGIIKAFIEKGVKLHSLA